MNKTRLAPTPSGFLHIGNIMSFLLTTRLARKTGAKVLLRIDDLDRERAEPGFVQDIFDTLIFLGISWDEGPRNYDEFETAFSQMHRMGLYRAALERLREQGVLFACNCSRVQIARDAPDGVYPGTCRDKGISLDAPDVNWRVRTDMERELEVRSPDGKTAKTSLDSSMKDFVVRKKDGCPAYQLASIIDDQYFGIDLIVRGRDLWPSTLAQLYLAELLPGSCFSDTKFYHHELLRDEEGGKLSKSAGAGSIQFLRKEGRTVAEIYRMIGENQ